MSQSFSEFIRERYGSAWVLAPRLTARLKDRGFRCAIPQELYKALELQWAQQRAHNNPDILTAARVRMNWQDDEAARILSDNIRREIVAALPPVET